MSKRIHFHSRDAVSKSWQLLQKGNKFYNAALLGGGSRRSQQRMTGENPAVRKNQARRIDCFSPEAEVLKGET